MLSSYCDKYLQEFPQNLAVIYYKEALKDIQLSFKKREAENK